jgi:hypothetical protein
VFLKQSAKGYIHTYGRGGEKIRKRKEEGGETEQSSV